MTRPAARPKSPLSRSGILLRAGLAACLAFIAGTVIAFRLGAGDDDFLIGRGAQWLGILRLLSVPAAFGLTWWRLGSLAGTPPPTAFNRFARAAAFGAVGWGVASLAESIAFRVWGWLLPPGTEWVVCVVSALVAWRRSHPRAPVRAARPDPGLWGALLGGTLGLVVGAAVFVVSVLAWQHTPYAWAPFVTAPLVAYVVYRLVVHLDRIGAVRSPVEIAGAVVAGVVVEAGAELTDEAIAAIAAIVED